MAEKRYFGFIREKENQFGKYLEVGFRAEELKELAGIAQATGGWVNIMVSPRRTVSEKGATHSGQLHEKSQPQSSSPSQRQDGPGRSAPPPKQAEDDNDSIPF